MSAANPESHPRNTARGNPDAPIAPGKAEPPVAEMVARWLALGCLTTLLVLAVGFVAMGVVVGRGLFQ